MDVSIIIVNYNTLSLTSSCIESVVKNTLGIEYEIILVDNASTDGSKERFQNDNRVNYIYNSTNYGFGKANNIGSKSAKGKYLLLLNSDTIIIDDSIAQMFKFMESHIDFVSCGVSLLDANYCETYSHGKFYSLFEDFSSIGFYKFYRNYYENNLSNVQYASQGDITNIDYISGADIFIRKDIYEEMNGFDEDYFMYYEETDLFYRLKLANYKSCILPYLNIIHLEGGSFDKSGKLNLRRFILSFKSKLLFLRKHKKKYYIFWAKLFLLIKIFTRPKIFKGYYINIISEIF